MLKQKPTITTKQMAIKCKKMIIIYNTLLTTKSKTIQKKIFQPTTNTPLDCLKDKNNNISIDSQVIAQEIMYTHKIL